jgi:hypothetical protein
VDQITKEEMDALEACKTPEEWGSTCDLIKDRRNGQYPRMKLSGKMDKIMSRWGGSSELSVRGFDDATDLFDHLKGPSL